jgi:hypothetical protein
MSHPTEDPPNDLIGLLDRLELSPDPPLSAEVVERDFAEILAQMTPAERISASRHGGFTRRERSIWAALFPEEVPLINGEFEWLAADLADLD